MLRSILCAMLILATQSLLCAGDNSKPSSTEPATSTPSTIAHHDARPIARLAGRKNVEAQLQAPAGLDFGDQHSITLKELLTALVRPLAAAVNCLPVPARLTLRPE